MAVLTVILLASLPAAGAAAQPRPAAPARPEAPARPARPEAAAPVIPAAVDAESARDTRDRLREILEQYPPSVGQVLRLDPSLLTKAERFHVHIVTQLADDEVRRMRMIPAHSLEEALATLSPDAKGYIMPRGAALLPVID